MRIQSEGTQLVAAFKSAKLHGFICPSCHMESLYLTHRRDTQTFLDMEQSRTKPRPMTGTPMCPSPAATIPNQTISKARLDLLGREPCPLSGIRAQRLSAIELYRRQWSDRGLGGLGNGWVSWVEDGRRGSCPDSNSQEKKASMPWISQGSVCRINSFGTTCTRRGRIPTRLDDVPVAGTDC